MENGCLYKIDGVYTVGISKSKRLKVTALNLWEAVGYALSGSLLQGGHPTTSPPSKKIGFFSY